MVKLKSKEVQNMVILKRIGVLSLAKVETVLMAFVGLIFGIYYATIMASSGELAGLSGGLRFLIIIIISPIIYAIVGFIAGAVGAFLYNLVARWLGGIEIDFEQ